MKMIERFSTFIIGVGGKV